MTIAVRKPRPYMNVTAFTDLIAFYPDEERWELLDGEPVLMAPQSEMHQRVVARLQRVFDRLADRRGCFSVTGLGILSDAMDDYAPIPDIVVRCGPPVSGGYVTDPIVVAEVLSPSTMSNDRGRKLTFFQTIPSLRTILIVEQDEARIEAWQRSDDGWTRTILKDGAAVLPLPELGGELRLAEVYDGLGPLA